MVFPRCRVLLDGVHVERYFRDKVFPGNLLFITATIVLCIYCQGARYEDGSPVDKLLIMERVLACRDSHTSEQYNGCRRDLMELTDGLMIRPGRVKHEVSFRNYYEVNWESIQPMWVLAYRKRFPLQVNDSASYRPPILHK